MNLALANRHPLALRRISILIITLLVCLVLIMPVSSLILVVTPSSNTDETCFNHEILDLEEPQEPAPEALVPSTDSIPTTRGRSRVDEEESEGNDYYYDPKILMSNPVPVEGTITSSDMDWFEIELEGNLNSVDNLTVSVTQLFGGTGTLFIYLYGWFDINQDGDIDHDGLGPGEDELILMKMAGYTVGSPGSDTTFASAFISGPYYIQLSLSGSGTVTYELYIDGSAKVSPKTSNQNPGRATSISEYSNMYNKIVDMDLDPFDWYRLASNLDDYPNAEGVNFTIKVEIEASLPSQTYDDGVNTVHFFTELIMIVLHEGISDGLYRKSTVKRASIHHHSNLPKGISFFEVKASPEGEPFDKTYIGFYAYTYGKAENDPNTVWHGTGDYGDGWVKYSIKSISAIPIYRPKLTGANVISIASKTEWGKSYDEYEYTVVYTQCLNFYPYVISVTINGADTRDMVKANPNDKSYSDGCKYIMQYSGLMLGEGIYHTYQFHAWDRNAHAIGSVELGTTNYGPYVSNNIRPYVRPTAVREYNLTEDSELEYLGLDEIFEDANNDSLTFSVWNTTDNAFTTTYESERIQINIINNSILEFNPKINMSGVDIINLTVTDGNYSLEPALEFTVNLESVNDPPLVIQHLGSIEIQEDNVYSKINLNNFFTDPVEQTDLLFNHTRSPNIDVEIQPDGKLILTPHENWFGNDKIVFTANDGFIEIYDILYITVHPVNDPPSLEFEPVLEVNQSEWCNITFIANDKADGDVLVYETNILEIITELNANRSKYEFKFNSSEGVLSFFTSNELVGSYDITVKVEDPYGDNHSKILTIKIIDINDAPVVKIISPEYYDAFLTTDKITFIGEARDPEDQNMDFVWVSDRDGELGQSLVRKDYTLSEGTHNITLFATDSSGDIGNYTILIRIFCESPLDTDCDGIFDYWEYILKLDPHDSRDAGEDPDGDGYTNLEEFYGDDGSPYGDDSTDPWNPETHPSKHVLTEDQYSGRLYIYIAAFIVLTIIMIILVFYMLIKGKKDREANDKRAEEIELNKLKTRQRQDLYGGGGKGLEDRHGDGDGDGDAPDIRCHKCGEAIPVYSVQRPVVIVCQMCDTRGVVYD